MDYKQRDPFRLWARENGYLLPRASNEAPSHLLLNGGRLRVRDCDSSFFLAKYASYLERGGRPYVVELRTPTFKLMMDLDICAQTPLSGEQQIQLSRHIHEVVLSTFQSEAVTLACTSPSKHKADGSYKTGIHLVFDNVYVTSSIALAFRCLLLDSCRQAFPSELHFTVSWDNIIDQCVYTGAGAYFWNDISSSTPSYLPYHASRCLQACG